MVASMRHWATVSGIIEDIAGEHRFKVTDLGRFFFNTDSGHDLYMENPCTAWIVHWQVSGHPFKTTWFWAFNHYSSLTFERDTIVDGIRALAHERAWSRVAIATIKRDVSCFVRTYVSRPRTRKDSYEDSLESPLAELGLIKASSSQRDGFRFVRGPKPSLGIGVFCYALTEFWNERFPQANTLSFEALAYEPGSPGRVFLLDENALVDFLGEMDRFTSGVYRWSETAGLQQLVREKGLSWHKALALLATDYDPGVWKSTT